MKKWTATSDRLSSVVAEGVSSSVEPNLQQEEIIPESGGGGHVQRVWESLSRAEGEVVREGHNDRLIARIYDCREVQALHGRVSIKWVTRVCRRRRDSLRSGGMDFQTKCLSISAADKGREET
jgi:hypothetical protein